VGWERAQSGETFISSRRAGKFKSRKREPFPSNLPSVFPSLHKRALFRQACNLASLAGGKMNQTRGSNLFSCRFAALARPLLQNAM